MSTADEKSLLLEPLTTSQCEEIVDVYARNILKQNPLTPITFEGGLGIDQRLTASAPIHVVSKIVAFSNEGQTTLSLHLQQPGTIDENGSFTPSPGPVTDLFDHYQAAIASAHETISKLSLTKQEEDVFGKRMNTPAKRLAAINTDVALTKPAFMPTYTKEQLVDRDPDAVSGPATRAFKIQIWCDSTDGGDPVQLPTGSLATAVASSNRPFVRPYDVHIGKSTMDLAELLSAAQLRPLGDTFIWYGGVTLEMKFCMNLTYRRITFRPTVKSFTWIAQPPSGGVGTKRPVVEFDDNIAQMYVVAKRARVVLPTVDE